MPVFKHEGTNPPLTLPWPWWLIRQ